MSRAFRFFRDLRYRVFYGLLLNRRFPLLELGDRSTGCSWRFCPEGLDRRSIVYSGGVGRDISFEHALVQKFGCDIVLFDPSPTGAETMARPENRIPKFHFHPVGLSGTPGTLKLAAPLNSQEGSWFMNASSEALI